MRKQAWIAGLAFVIGAPATAQDIRGLEVCTAERQMERRTSCLQSNVEFLQKSLVKLQREAQDKFAAAGRELAVANAEIAALKSALAKLEVEVTALKGKPIGKLK